jgi:hypothetical protein
MSNIDVTRTPLNVEEIIPPFGTYQQPIVISDSPTKFPSLNDSHILQLMEELGDSLRQKLIKNIQNKGIKLDLVRGRGSLTKNNRVILDAMLQLGFKYDDMTTVRDIGTFAEMLSILNDMSKQSKPMDKK